MNQYLDACRLILSKGKWKEGRNGSYIGIQGHMMKFDLADGFPLLTTKEVPFLKVVAELFAFIRGAQSAAIFRQFGTKIWDKNANKNEQWLNNPNREGEDDLGRIYGVQWRGWRKYTPISYPDSAYNVKYHIVEIDQLARVIEDLKQHKDNRREIVTAWNPGEIEQMAIPPCHMFYQFGIEEDRLNLGMYQRSCDFPLGIPFNIASYALFLMIVAKIANLKPGVFTHMLWDCHIYGNQVEIMETIQLPRIPRQLPYVILPDRITGIDDIGTVIMPTDILLENYDPLPAIDYPFSV